jgi:hypothetical protein
MALALSKEGLLPTGRHRATLAEIEIAFVDGFPTSATRSVLLESFSYVREAIRRVVPIREQWLNGSFVTSKLHPGDIDVVTMFAGEDLDALDGPAWALLRGLVSDKTSQWLHGCDSYQLTYFASESEHHSIYLGAAAYWDGLFGHDRDGKSKGYISVVDDA